MKDGSWIRGCTKTTKDVRSDQGLNEPGTMRGMQSIYPASGKNQNLTLMEHLLSIDNRNS